MAATVAAGLLATLASNAMADAKAEAANENERQNMFMQNMLNRRNNVLAYSDQVQGAKMAGLSPAMLNGATPNVAAPVTKPNAHQAENVEFDPATLLLRAQKDNLDAQTEKTRAETAKIEGVDTENTRADIDLKTAQKLFTGANQAKVDEEAKQLRNVNQAFAEENSAMGLFGQTTAQEWQKAPWYEKLPRGAKMVIDDIARGEMDLTVGIANALNRAVSTDAQMSKLQKDKVQYAFDTAILDAQFSDDAIMKAIADAPKNEQERLYAQVDNIKAATAKLKAELPKIAAEIKNLKSDTALKVAEKRIKDLMYKQLNLDPDVRRYEGDWFGYFGSMGQKLLEGAINMLPALAGGYMTGRMAGSGIKNATSDAARQGSREGYSRGRAEGVGDSWEANRRRDSYFFYHKQGGSKNGSSGVEDLFKSNDW